MNAVIFYISNYEITVWHIVGILGTLIFSARWIIQLIQSARAKRSLITKHFWLVSATGNILLLAYFTFGNRDAIGILQNTFPLAIAIFNLFLIQKARQDINSDGKD